MGSKDRRERTSWSKSVLSTGTRLFIWYALVTAIFRCPGSISELTDTSPQLCEPYLKTRDHITPFVAPYYDIYAAPYVEIIRPYAEVAHAKVYEPAAAFASKNYIAYGAPFVLQAQDRLYQEWAKTIKPYFENARVIAWTQYRNNIGPVADKAWDVSEPYLRDSKALILKQYNDNLIPAYRRSLPYAQQAYSHIYHVSKETVIPYIRTGAESSVVFFNRKVWPRLRVVYGKNVEPQLMRIRERLLNYRDAKRLEASMDQIASSSEEPAEAVESSIPSSASSLASAIISRVTASISEVISGTASGSSVTSSETSAASSIPSHEKQITDELSIWQDKFERVTTKGAEDLQKRVSEITARQIEMQAHGVAKALITELEEVSEVTLSGLKKTINTAIGALPEDDDPAAVKAAAETIRDAIRASGATIKEKAQSVRAWKTSYNTETRSLVKSATESTLEVVDNIRDLGLQEIGMRWSSIDSVTYTDWSQYHALKKTVNEWRKKVESVVLEHKGLVEAEREGDEIESEAMTVAEAAAKELSRLKKVAVWKINALDSSDDFEDKILPPAVASVGQRVMDKITDLAGFITATSSKQGTLEAVASTASESARSVASQASSGASMASSAVSSALSDSIINPASEMVEKVASPASESFHSVSSKVSQSISTASQAGSGASASAASALRSVSLGVNDGASSIADAGAAASASAINALKSASAEASNGATSIAGAVKDASSSATDAVKYASTEASNSATSIASTMEEASSSATDAVKYASTEASNSATPIASTIEEASSSAVRNVDDTLSKASSSVSSASTAVVSQATDITSSVISRIPDQVIGSSKSGKLAEGISSVRKANKIKLSNLAAASASVKSAAEPSSVVQEAVSMASNVASHMHSVGSSAVSEASGAASRAASGL